MPSSRPSSGQLTYDRVRRYKGYLLQNEKRVCRACGQPFGPGHDVVACAEAWLDKLDAEGNPSNQRRQGC